MTLRSTVPGARRHARRASVIISVAFAVVIGGGAPLASTAAPEARQRWAWPTAERGAVLRSFVAPATRYAAGHRGIDIPATGPILAPAPGTVFFSGFVVDRPVLSIQHPGGVLSSFEPVRSELRPGDHVRAGEVIGEAVAGHCAPACIHVGVRRDGEYVSPLIYLGSLERAVLLPTLAIR